MFYSLDGVWQARLNDGSVHRMLLPGTLDGNQIGNKDIGSSQLHPDSLPGEPLDNLSSDADIATRFTRKYTYEGPVSLTKRIFFIPPQEKRVFLEAERARCLRLIADGKEIPDFMEPSLSTPHVFEITGLLGGDSMLTLISDNSYPGLPHDAIVYSSAATDETQTNWNGIIGYFRLCMEEAVFVSAIRVYPYAQTLTVKINLSAGNPYTGDIIINSAALAAHVTKPISVQEGMHEIVLENIPLANNVIRWDEYEGQLYELTVGLKNYEAKTVRFGIRVFGDDGRGRLAINGRTIFLRNEANCAVFPETGHPPMDTAAWLEILNTYKSYGINCMRFHSYCPPEAAFAAADQIGMLMQPELSNWNPKDAFESEDSLNYYQTELKQVIIALANHPSFVMLAFGNELHAGDTGHEHMRLMLEQARNLDNTRLYSNGSNVHYGMTGCDADSDFYTSSSFYNHKLRGTFAAEDESGIKGYVNNQYPNARTNYNASMKKLRESYSKPVFSFEVGQFEVLPDFDELTEFHGVTDPANLRLIQNRVKKCGFSGNDWKRYVEATGELAKLAYKEEIEAAMRTKELSGISLLGLQDFPGQGTALVGMLNSHLQPKPYDFARAESFRKFFRDQLPLVLLPKYTYETTEVLTAEILVANFGKEDIEDKLYYELAGDGILITGILPKIRCPICGYTKAGLLEIPLDSIHEPVRLDLRVTLAETENSYPIWVYPPVLPSCPASVYETRTFNEEAKVVLASGGNVYLSPPSSKESLPSSIRAQFTTDFWSVGTFPKQEGGMGQLIEASHPIFDHFPTDIHSNWQWWPMATQRAIIFPAQIKAIITEIDSYAYLRPMAQLLECRCGNGKLLLSSIGLQDLQQYPEARALLASIYQYMDSAQFVPKQEITIDAIAALVK